MYCYEILFEPISNQIQMYYETLTNQSKID